MFHQQHDLGKAGCHSKEAQSGGDDRSNSRSNGAAEADMIITETTDDATSTSIGLHPLLQVRSKSRP